MKRKEDRKKEIKQERKNESKKEPKKGCLGNEGGKKLFSDFEGLGGVVLRLGKFSVHK